MKDWYQMNEEELLKYLDASLDGLSSKQVQERINKYGENIIPTDYFQSYNFEDGMANVSVRLSKWNLIDKDGDEVFHIDSFFPLI